MVKLDSKELGEENEHQKEGKVERKPYLLITNSKLANNIKIQ